MPDSEMANVIKAILLASERAALIVRSCNSEALLVDEKFNEDANARFDRDFKTIADVLAQEAAKNEIKIHCPGLAPNVRGEECAEIGGVKIGIKESEEETTEFLSTLVSSRSAKSMAKAAHLEVKLTNLTIDEVLPENYPVIDPSDVGVWIDPIDATSEFINGMNGIAEPNKGLPCVTVLIGAYLKSTGEPIFGVINQPYFKNDPSCGRLVWGLSHSQGEIHKWGTSDKKVYPVNKTILMSAIENPDVVHEVTQRGWEIKNLPGAGNKLMNVALGQAAGYILSKGTTFRWDTCGPHAVLKGKGGDIINAITKQPLTYNDPDGLGTQAYCNSDGFFAYGNEEVYQELYDVLEIKRKIKQDN